MKLPDGVPTALICVPSLTFVSKSHCACTLRLHCCELATSSCWSNCLILLLDNVNGPCCGGSGDGCGSTREVNLLDVSKFCWGSSVLNFLPPRWNPCCCCCCCSCCCCCCSCCCCCCCCWNIPSKLERGCWFSCRCCCTAYLRKKKKKKKPYNIVN